MDITPKTSWKERRIKSGSFLDRKLSADILKVRRKHDSNIREIEKRTKYSAFMVAVCLLGALVLMVVFCRVSHADTISATDEIKAIIGEAEGEPQEGKEAVACAIHYRGNLAGVYGLHDPRVKKHLYSRQTWDNAVLAVYMAQDQEYCEGLIHGAQYWEGTAFPVPYWAKGMRLTAVIGHQRFFRKD